MDEIAKIELTLAEIRLLLVGVPHGTNAMLAALAERPTRESLQMISTSAALIAKLQAAEKEIAPKPKPQPS